MEVGLEHDLTGEKAPGGRGKTGRAADFVEPSTWDILGPRIRLRSARYEMPVAGNWREATATPSGPSR